MTYFLKLNDLKEILGSNPIYRWTFEYFFEITVHLKFQLTLGYDVIKFLNQKPKERQRFA